jgi:hypothetical protein
LLPEPRRAFLRVLGVGPSDYHVSDEHFTWFDSLVRTWDWLTDSQKTWRILQSGNVATTYQFKTNSGASRLLNRVNASATTAGPKRLTTNIAVPAISAGKAALYFLPDHILVREGNHFSDLAYAHLSVHAGDTQFIEDGATPGDAVQVGQTWQYVNVKGGPDRRYKNNRLLPIMRYGTLDFVSGHGLQWQLQVSRADAAAPVAHAVTTVPALTQTVTPPPAVSPRSAPKHRKASPAPPPIQTPQLQPQRIAPVPPPRSARAPPRGSVLARTDLTRKPTPYPASAATFTAIDLETTDSRHTTARKLGIPIISPAEGSVRLDEAVREAELKAYERQREIDRHTALRQQRADEADAYWRPSWRLEELDHDPEPEPWYE